MQGLSKEVVLSQISTLKQEIRRQTAMMEHLERLLPFFEGVRPTPTGRGPGRPPRALSVPNRANSSGNSGSDAPRPQRGGGRRRRRTREDLEKRAQTMIDFIRNKGEATGRDINKEFGVMYGQTTKQFLDKYAPDAVHTRGEKAKMVYVAR